MILELSAAIYEAEAILRTSYKFNDKFYIHVDLVEGNTFKVSFKSKDVNHSLGNIADEFCNELIDQQVRVITERNFSNIRDEIVKKAFSPIA